MVLPHKKSKSNGNKIYSNPNIIILLLQMDDNVKFDFLFYIHNIIITLQTIGHMTYQNMITNLNIIKWRNIWGKKMILNHQALDSMSSSISRTACSGPLPNIMTLSDGLFRLRGPFPNKQTCGSIWFNRFHSSSERDQLKMSIFLFILSGFKLHGRTLVPLCSPHRNITYNNRLQIKKSTPNISLKSRPLSSFLAFNTEQYQYTCTCNLLVSILFIIATKPPHCLVGCLATNGKFVLLIQSQNHYLQSISIKGK